MRQSYIFSFLKQSKQNIAKLFLTWTWVTQNIWKVEQRCIRKNIGSGDLFIINSSSWTNHFIWVSIFSHLKLGMGF